MPENEDCLKNPYQIVKQLADRYQVTHYRVCKAIENHELSQRRGGGWSTRTVEQWAKTMLNRKIDASMEADAPALPPSANEGGNGQGDVLQPQSISEQKQREQASLLAVQRQRAEMDFLRERGKLTETKTITDELAARVRAFRLGLERFGTEEAEAVAADFGGNARAARDLGQRLGFEGDALTQAQVTIQNFILSRSQVFAAHWRERVEGFLDPYATGLWWTDEMRAAWQKLEEGSSYDAEQ